MFVVNEDEVASSMILLVQPYFLTCALTLSNCNDFSKTASIHFCFSFNIAMSIVFYL